MATKSRTRRGLLVSLAMVNLGHLGVRSTASRRNPNTQSTPVQVRTTTARRYTSRKFC